MVFDSLRFFDHGVESGRVESLFGDVHAGCAPSISRMNSGPSRVFAPIGLICIEFTQGSL